MLDIYPISGYAQDMNKSVQSKKKGEAHIYFPIDIFVKLKAIALANRRTMSAEIVIAVEEHLQREAVKRG